MKHRSVFVLLFLITISLAALGQEIIEREGENPFEQPESGKGKYIYVVGDVGNPGALEIESGRTILGSQAISKAGGPNKTAEMSKGILLKYDQKGMLIEKPIDFTAILRGEEEDFEVYPGDIIFIPGSAGKSLYLDPPMNFPDYRNPPPIC